MEEYAIYLIVLVLIHSGAREPPVMGNVSRGKEGFSEFGGWIPTREAGMSRPL